MPELPEVETIRRNLEKATAERPSILGQEVRSASLFWEKTLATQNLAELNRILPRRKVLSTSRRGKFLILCFGDWNLIFHLRMSGDLRIEKNLWPAGQREPGLPHDRFYLHFNSGYSLAFNDTRKFGRIWFTAEPESILFKLGIDPFAAELTLARFYAMLHAKNRQLKPLLLDQGFIAGVGNIYADESLHAAGLHPLRNSKSVTPDEAEKLLRSMRNALSAGIAHNGASIDWVYRGGDFQNYFKVYHRKGEPCPVCGTAVERILVGQRSTHFCPHCQPMDKKEV